MRNINSLHHFEIIAHHDMFCNFTQVKIKYLFNSKIKYLFKSKINYLLLLTLYIVHVLHLDCEARLD